MNENQDMPDHFNKKVNSNYQAFENVVNPIKESHSKHYKEGFFQEKLLGDDLNQDVMSKDDSNEKKTNLSLRDKIFTCEDNRKNYVSTLQSKVDSKMVQMEHLTAIQQGSNAFENKSSSNINVFKTNLLPAACENSHKTEDKSFNDPVRDMEIINKEKVKNFFCNSEQPGINKINESSQECNNKLPQFTDDKFNQKFKDDQILDISQNTLKRKLNEESNIEGRKVIKCNIFDKSKQTIVHNENFLSLHGRIPCHLPQKLSHIGKVLQEKVSDDLLHDDVSERFANTRKDKKIGLLIEPFECVKNKDDVLMQTGNTSLLIESSECSINKDDNVFLQTTDTDQQIASPECTTNKDQILPQTTNTDLHTGPSECSLNNDRNLQQVTKTDILIESSKCSIDKHLVLPQIPNTESQIKTSKCYVDKDLVLAQSTNMDSRIKSSKCVIKIDQGLQQTSDEDSQIESSSCDIYKDKVLQQTSNTNLQIESSESAISKYEVLWQTKDTDLRNDSSECLTNKDHILNQTSTVLHIEASECDINKEHVLPQTTNTDLYIESSKCALNKDHILQKANSTDSESEPSGCSVDKDLVLAQTTNVDLRMESPECAINKDKILQQTTDTDSQIESSECSINKDLSLQQATNTDSLIEAAKCSRDKDLVLPQTTNTDLPDESSECAINKDEVLQQTCNPDSQIKSCECAIDKDQLLLQTNDTENIKFAEDSNKSVNSSSEEKFDSLLRNADRFSTLHKDEVKKISSKCRSEENIFEKEILAEKLSEEKKMESSKVVQFLSCENDIFNSASMLDLHSDIKIAHSSNIQIAGAFKYKPSSKSKTVKTCIISTPNEDNSKSGGISLIDDPIHDSENINEEKDESYSSKFQKPLNATDENSQQRVNKQLNLSTSDIMHPNITGNETSENFPQNSRKRKLSKEENHDTKVAKFYNFDKVKHNTNEYSKSRDESVRFYLKHPKVNMNENAISQHPSDSILKEDIILQHHSNNDKAGVNMSLKIESNINLQNASKFLNKKGEISIDDTDLGSSTDNNSYQIDKKSVEIYESESSNSVTKEILNDSLQSDSRISSIPEGEFNEKSSKSKKQQNISVVTPFIDKINEEQLTESLTTDKNLRIEKESMNSVIKENEIVRSYIQQPLDSLEFESHSKDSFFDANPISASCETSNYKVDTSAHSVSSSPDNINVNENILINKSSEAIKKDDVDQSQPVVNTPSLGKSKISIKNDILADNYSCLNSVKESNEFKTENNDNSIKCQLQIAPEIGENILLGSYEKNEENSSFQLTNQTASCEPINTEKISNAIGISCKNDAGKEVIILSFKKDPFKITIDNDASSPNSIIDLVSDNETVNDGPIKLESIKKERDFDGVETPSKIRKLSNEHDDDNSLNLIIKETFTVKNETHQDDEYGNDSKKNNDSIKEVKCSSKHNDNEDGAASSDVSPERRRLKVKNSVKNERNERRSTHSREIHLSQFLQEIAKINPSVLMVKERYDTENRKVKVHCVAFDTDVLNWALSDTLLTSYENSKRIRNLYNTDGLPNTTFFDTMRSKDAFLHPIHITKQFPFSMPTCSVNSPIGEAVDNLPFALQSFTSLCPSKVIKRVSNRNKLPSKAVPFSEEALEWAFKETYLSTLEDSPILCDLVEMNSKKFKVWPDATEIYLRCEDIDYTFPFTCPVGKEKYDLLLFQQFDVDLPKHLVDDSFQFLELPFSVENNIYTERDALIRLLALASYYKHCSDIFESPENNHFQICHKAILASFKPLIISQANSFAFAIREARKWLLNNVKCNDKTIIPLLINGPIYCNRRTIYANLPKLHNAVERDSANKLRQC